MGAPPGERHGRAKLTEAQVKEIRSRYGWNSKDTYMSLANEFHVSLGTMSAILNRKTWRHV